MRTTERNQQNVVHRSSSPIRRHQRVLVQLLQAQLCSSSDRPASIGDSGWHSILVKNPKWRLHLPEIHKHPLSTHLQGMMGSRYQYISDCLYHILSNLNSADNPSHPTSKHQTFHSNRLGYLPNQGRGYCRQTIQ